jgi:hypothetical protein
LKGNGGLSRAGGHGEQNSFLSLKHRFQYSIDRDLLIITLAFANCGIGWREQFSRGFYEGFASTTASMKSRAKRSK